MPTPLRIAIYTAVSMTIQLVWSCLSVATRAAQMGQAPQLLSASQDNPMRLKEDLSGLMLACVVIMFVEAAYLLSSNAKVSDGRRKWRLSANEC